MNISDFKEQIKRDLKLKFYRDSHDLSQRDVAKIMKITQAQYQRLETGLSMLSAHQILLLCRLYKCSPNDLLGFKGELTFYQGELDQEV